MFKILRFLLTFVLFWHFVISASFLKKHMLQLHRFTQCEGQENLPMLFDNITVTTVKRKITINCKILVRHDIKNDIALELQLQRCKNKDAPDTCQKYQTLRFPKSCNLLNAKNQFWSPFLQNVKPLLLCPIKPMVYSVDNASFDPNLALFPVNGWYWKTTLNTFDVKTKEHLTCIYLEGEVVAVAAEN